MCLKFRWENVLANPHQNLFHPCKRSFKCKEENGGCAKGNEENAKKYMRYAMRLN